MHRKLPILLGLLVLAAGCMPATLPAQPAPAASPLATAAPQPFQLTVLHSNDTWGYLLPCG
jgi:hypothetical protein